ncbi:MAG TPA: 50S ribosomal protein L30 [Bacillota bacterium]|nr:50S ribosomal protein L30 [Bacillota bacterium]
MSKDTAMLKVTLVKSLIACKPKQKATAYSLGLRKIGDSAVAEDDAVTAGKVKVLSHLVKVEKKEA